MIRRFQLFALSLAALAFGSVACTAPQRPAGSRCVFNGDCREPLVCAGQTCRVPCRTMADCAIGQVCRPAGAGVSVCVPPGDPPLCGPDLVCASPLLCAIDGFCRPPCRTNYDCRFVRTGSHCSAAGVCEDDDAGAPDASVDAGMDATADSISDTAPDAAAADTNAEAAFDAPVADASGDVGGEVFVPDDVYPFDIPPMTEFALHVRAAGEAAAHRCVVTTAGRIECWGENRSGSLGRGTTSTTPALVPAHATAFSSATTWVDVVGAWLAGPYQSTTCALSNAGTVFCVGQGNYGQLGNGATLNSTTVVQVTGISTAVQLSMADGHGCVVLASGSVMCWGNGLLGNRTVTPPSSTPVMVAGITDAVQVAAAEQHNCALRRTGQVVCWGSGTNGELGNGTGAFSEEPVVVSGITTAVQITAQRSTTCARLMDGTARCWGLNNEAQTGIGSATPMAVLTPMAVVGVTGIVDLNTAGRATCAVAGPERRVWCWGFRSALGAGPGAPSGTMPVEALSLRDIVSLSSGGEVNTSGGYFVHFCARRPDDSLWCWGANGFGELGNGTTVGGERPRAVVR